jgi:hypothetical protein
MSMDPLQLTHAEFTASKAIDTHKHLLNAEGYARAVVRCALETCIQGWFPEYSEIFVYKVWENGDDVAPDHFNVVIDAKSDSIPWEDRREKIPFDEDWTLEHIQQAVRDESRKFHERLKEKYPSYYSII